MSEQFIGRYRVLCRLGAGGMAEVFLASSTGEQGFEKRVAIKRIHEEMRLEDRHVNAFADEARLLAQLNHPNIVQVFSFEHDGSSHFLVMEYVEGVPLSKALRLASAQELHLPLDAALSIGVQVCEALDYAHSARSYDGAPMRIVHRDIKPANLLLTSQGQVKVTDFGIARAATNVHQTATGSGKGTLAYMAPEQLDARSVEPQADLFALGAVLFELVTGRLLFEFTEWAAFMQRRQQGLRPQDLQAIRMAAPEVVPLLVKALEQAPEDRFTSAAEMGKAIRGLTSYRGREPLRDWARSLTSTEITLGEVPPTQTANHAATPTVADVLVPAARQALTAPLGAPTADPPGRPARGPSWIAAVAAVVLASGVLLIWRPWVQTPAAPDAGGDTETTRFDALAADDDSAERTTEATTGGTGTGDDDSAAGTETIAGPVSEESPTPEPPTPEQPTPEPPRPEPVDESPTEAVAPAGDGTLTVTSRPWAKIFVDGQLRGDGDPVRDLKLPLGSHTIRVSRDDPDHPVADMTVTIELTQDGENQAWTFVLPDGRDEWTSRRLQ